MHREHRVTRRTLCFEHVWETTVSKVVPAASSHQMLTVQGTDDFIVEALPPGCNAPSCSACNQSSPIDVFGITGPCIVNRCDVNHGHVRFPRTLQITAKLGEQDMRLKDLNRVKAILKPHPDEGILTLIRWLKLSSTPKR